MMDTEEAKLISAVTKTHIDIPEEEKEVDMCKAIEDIINDSKSELARDWMAECSGILHYLMH